MKIIYTFLFFTVLCYANVNGQNTYTWNVSSGDWNTPSSWTPSRTSPASNDILIFNGNSVSNASAFNIQRETVGQLQFINNINVRLTAGSRISGTGTITRSAANVTGTGTSFLTELLHGDLLFYGTTYGGEIINITSNTSLTASVSGALSSTAFTICPAINVNNGAFNALYIQNGSTVTLGDSGAEPMVLRVLTGSKANIEGTVRLLYSRNRLVGVDSASVIINSGGLVRTDSSYVGNPFLFVGAANTVIFKAGSSIDIKAGSNPFALTVPLSKVYFDKGSNYLQTTTALPSIAGRNFGNFVFNATSLSITQNNTTNIDSLIILQGYLNITSSNTTNINNIQVSSGTLNMNISGGNTNIGGNIQVDAAGNLNMNGKFASSPANLNFNGLSQQKIAGAGTIRISTTADSALHVRVQNLSGVLLQKGLELNASILNMDSGYINLNNNTLTIGTSALQGRVNQLNGYVTGTGTLTRWYNSTNNTTGDSSLFPLGVNGDKYPCWVSGTPSSDGTVSVTSFSHSSSTIMFSSPFTDASANSSVTVDKRLNDGWALSTGNGLTGTMDLRLSAPVPSGFITDVSGIRVTLANGVAPGTLSEDGTGSLTQPVAGKTGLSVAQLNNTFYMGANSNTNPLPLAFVSVEGKRSGTANLISWSTAQEINVSRFEIEKSTDNNIFFTIGAVDATNTKSAAQYNFEDAKGTDAFYRIKAIDYNGDLTYSNNVYISQALPQNSLSVYPNPATDFLKISGTVMPDKIEVINQLGKEVEAGFINGNLDVHALEAGVYYVRVSTEGLIRVLKFVKQ